MKKYKAVFTGRTLGAIGINYPLETTCEGLGEDDARLDLYNRYEHVHFLKLTEIFTDPADKL